MFDLPDTASLVFVILFGLSAGSFLNVLIYRLPRRESVFFPGSRCPACNVPIRFHDNIPVLSFLFLRGRCRDCGTAISYRYPLVETVTALMIVGIFVIQGWTLDFVADSVFIVILTAAALIDLEHMIIPNRLNYPAILLGALLTFRWGTTGFLRGFNGAIVGILILSFMYWLGKLIYRRDGVGMGDFKLASAMGFFFGPFWTGVALILAVVIGGVIGMILMFAGRTARFQEVPFGPFISAGGLLVMFFRPQILFLVERYLSLL